MATFLAKSVLEPSPPVTNNVQALIYEDGLRNNFLAAGLLASRMIAFEIGLTIPGKRCNTVLFGTFEIALSFFSGSNSGLSLWRKFILFNVFFSTVAFLNT